jgi:hypothetical protein
MKKKFSLLSFLKISMLALSCVTVLTSYAQSYYVISSDSNNCKVHWDDKQKGFVYITGSDCTCMQKDSDHLSVQWVANFGDEHTPLGCYPAVNNADADSLQSSSGYRRCGLNDHCTQYECLKLIYADETEQPVERVTVDQDQCIDMNKKPLPLCDKNGSQCQ